MESNNSFDILSEGRMPFSVEAEQSVIGSIIIDPTCLNLVQTMIKPDYFYIENHQKIYSTLTRMYETNVPIDFITLLERLKSEGVYDDAGGKSYLTQLVQCVPTTANLENYISIVRDKHIVRSLMKAAQNIIKDINENAETSGDLLDKAEQRIYEIRQGRNSGDLVLIKDVIVNETYDRLMKVADPETHNDYVGIPSGIAELDKTLTGLNKSDLIILGARPGMGKTSFALNIARNVAVNGGKRVCFFSLEMSRDQLAQRLLSNEAAIESSHLRDSSLMTVDEWTRLAMAAEQLSKTQMYLDETPSITVPEMKAKLRRLGNVDLVIIDYLGLMHSATVKESRVQEVSDITRNLKIMAKELKVPVIACAQLSRGTEGKNVKSHKPQLSDLRDSGSIEQDADIVLFLYREKYYDTENTDPENVADPNKAECIVAKNRHGECKTIPLYWDGQFTRFTSQATGYEEH
ncbi:MAG: replicative DNA helicase [Clostridia bacterium]|nr:replicative DNA helicase [Clostridia bacterium]